MTTMISELYDALKEAGASEEKARRAVCREPDLRSPWEGARRAGGYQAATGRGHA